MNFTYIECFLTDLLGASEEFTKDQIKKLLVEIKEHKDKDKYTDSIHNVLPVLNSCRIDFLILVDELEYILKNGTTPQKINKIEEILTKLSSTLYYYTDVLNRENLDLGTNKKDGDYIRKFVNEKEFFKEQAKQYVTQLTGFRVLEDKERTQIQYNMEKLKREG
jgi:hypothetical protein